MAQRLGALVAALPEDLRSICNTYMATPVGGDSKFSSVLYRHQAWTRCTNTNEGKTFISNNNNNNNNSAHNKILNISQKDSAHVITNLGC